MSRNYNIGDKIKVKGSENFRFDRIDNIYELLGHNIFITERISRFFGQEKIIIDIIEFGSDKKIFYQIDGFHIFYPTECFEEPTKKEKFSFVDLKIDF